MKKLIIVFLFFSSHVLSDVSKNLNIGVESGANLIFKLKNNLIINLILNFDSKIFSRKCRINFNNSKKGRFIFMTKNKMVYDSSS